MERHGEILLTRRSLATTANADGWRSSHRSMWVDGFIRWLHFKPTNWWHRSVGHGERHLGAKVDFGLWVRSFLVRR